MYQFRPITDDNLSDVAAVFQSVVQKTVTTRYLRSKYKTPWSKGQMWGFIAYEASTGKPVAVAGALPCLIVAGGRNILAAQTMDTLTDPAHSGRGLMTTLLRMTTEALSAEGIQLFFGFCNQNSHHLYIQKLGWQQLFKMECYFLPGAVFPMEALLRRSGLTFLWRFFAKKILGRYASPLEGFPNSLEAEGYSYVLHDTAYFRYKNFTFNCLANIAGTLAWIKADGGLLVGDVQCNTGTDFDAFLRGAQQLARRLGLRRVIFQVSPGTRLQTELVKRIPTHGSWVVVAQDLTQSADLATLRFTYGDVDTY